MRCIRQTKFLVLKLQPVRLVDPHLAATFSNTFKQAELWVTTELVNTSSAPTTVIVRLNVSLDVDGDTCIVDHVYASEKIVIEGSSTTLFSLQPVSFSTLILRYQNHNKSLRVRESCELITVLVSKLKLLSRSRIADVFVVYFRTKNVKLLFLCCFTVARSPPLYTVTAVFVSHKLVGKYLLQRYH